MRRFDTIIFDLDGTLLDTLEDLANAVNVALEANGYPKRTLEEVRCFVGNGVRNLMERAVPDGTSAEMIEESLKVFKDYYAAHSQVMTKPYPGIMELLQSLKNDGFKISVLSNKYDAAVKSLCNKYFSGLIDLPVGERPGIAKKPAPDGIFDVMKALNIEAARTLYIGDSEVDVKTSKNAGLTFVGVTWGFRDRSVLEENFAEYIIDSPEELRAILEA